MLSQDHEVSQEAKQPLCPDHHPGDGQCQLSRGHALWWPWVEASELSCSPAQGSKEWSVYLGLARALLSLDQQPLACADRTAPREAVC